MLVAGRARSGLPRKPRPVKIFPRVPYTGHPSTAALQHRTVGSARRERDDGKRELAPISCGYEGAAGWCVFEAAAPGESALGRGLVYRCGELELNAVGVFERQHVDAERGQAGDGAVGHALLVE